jgi:hypothetical protein
VASAGIHGDDCRLQRIAFWRDGRCLPDSGGARRKLLLPFFDRFQPAGDSAFGSLLHRQVDRREDAQPALVHTLPAESFDQLSPDLLLEILAVRLVVSKIVVENNPFGAGSLPGRTVDVAVIHHRGPRVVG